MESKGPRVFFVAQLISPGVCPFVKKTPRTGSTLAACPENSEVCLWTSVPLVKSYTLGCPPFPVTVTTRIITCLVGDPKLNLHLPQLLGGGTTQVIPNVFQMFPKIGVFYPPKSSIFNRAFHCFYHPFWGKNTPIFGLTPIYR